MSDERDKPQPGMVTLAGTFGKQLEFMTKAYDVISLDDLVHGLSARWHHRRRCIVITFDDGWRDNYVLAFPLLKSRGVPATVFLATDYIESEKVFWFHTVNAVVRNGWLTSEQLEGICDGCHTIDQTDKAKLLSTIDQPDEFIEHIKRLDPGALRELTDRITDAAEVHHGEMTDRRWVLNWDEIKEMGKHGISFGSHTCSHTILTRLQPGDIEEELQNSKRIIEQNAGNRVASLAYPNGDFNSQVKELVEKAGYTCACAGSKVYSTDDPIDPFALPRWGIHEGTCKGIGGRFSKAIFACYVAGLFLRRRR